MRKQLVLIIVVLMPIIVQYTLPAQANPAEVTLNTADCTDPSLALSIPAAFAGVDKGQITLVDVRPAKEYAEYHIPGSLNIAPYAIKTKTYLKRSTTVALVNNGYAICEIVATCHRLNDSGFTAKILEGGILAWQTKGGDIVGDSFKMTAINRVPAQRFGQELGNSNYLLIDATPQGLGMPDREKWVSQAVHLPLLERKQALAELKKLRTTGMAQPFFTMLVYTATGEENDRLQRLLKAEGLPQVYFLEGGLQAFSKYKQFQILAKKSKGERLIQTDGAECAACSQQ